MLKQHIYAAAEEQEAKKRQVVFPWKKKHAAGPCSLMFDESNLAELGLNVSELGSNAGQRRAGERQRAAVSPSVRNSISL